MKIWRPLEKKNEWDQAVMQACESAYSLKVMFNIELDEFAFMDEYPTNTSFNTTPWLNTRTETGASSASIGMSESESIASEYQRPIMPGQHLATKLSSKLMSSLSLKPPRPRLRDTMVRSISTISVEDAQSAPIFEKQQRFARTLEQRLIKTRF